MARCCRTGSCFQLAAVLAGLATLPAVFGVAMAPAAIAIGQQKNDMFQKALQLFRFDNNTGHIEFIDHSYLYDGEASNKPLEVIAVFGTTSSGKSTACRFLSCSLKDPTDFPSSTIGANHVPTRGLWASHMVDIEGGRNIVLLDIEGTDNSEQDMHISQALTKLLALLSEVTSVFIQLRRTPTIQSSDLEDLASFVSRVRSTLLRRPDSFSGKDAGEHDNFPALLIAHVLSYDVYDTSQAYKITKQALEKQSDVIGTIHENYIQLGRHEGVNLHFEYLPIYEVPGPRARELQRYIDTIDNSTELLSKVGALADKNTEPDEPLHWAGRKFLEDIDRLRNKILAVSRPRLDGENRRITPRTFRQLLKRGVEEMNKVGPLSNVHFWEKIEIDSCTKHVQSQVTEIGEKLKVAEQMDKDILQEIDRLKQELEIFFQDLGLRTDGAADRACREVLDVQWRLTKGPYETRAVQKQLDKAKTDAEKAREQVEAANKIAEEEKRKRQQDAWSAYVERNFPWVAAIFASFAIILHKFASCCGSSGAVQIAGHPDPALVASMRQMETELVTLRVAQQSGAAKAKAKQQSPKGGNHR
eukprot:TRINITY_DN41830_c0_g1_i1.p1 TRINITY_DN41830_c0_g1~~TRINITY_DN41830_c0_g1_i1.p1  ORF type:complete len:586 (+),score=93.58 TRINITY_DN41830_c0_g1_i1:29-1786(+)